MIVATVTSGGAYQIGSQSAAQRIAHDDAEADEAEERRHPQDAQPARARPAAPAGARRRRAVMPVVAVVTVRMAVRVGVRSVFRGAHGSVVPQFVFSARYCTRASRSAGGIVSLKGGIALGGLKPGGR